MKSKRPPIQKRPNSLQLAQRKKFNIVFTKKVNKTKLNARIFNCFYIIIVLDVTLKKFVKEF